MIFELLYAAFLILLIFLGLKSTYFFKNNIELNKLTGYGFLLKSIATIALMMIFEKIAPNANLFIDTRGYMKDTAHLSRVFSISPITYFKFLTGIGETNELVLTYLSETNLWDKGHGLYNDSKNVVRINSLIYFLSKGNVYIHVVFMSLFSTMGIRFFVLAFKKHIEGYKVLFFMLLFLVPSIFISTGGVLKEPLLVLGIGLFLYPLLSENQRKWKWVTFSIGILLLISIKPYVLILILLGLLFFLFSKYVLSQKPGMSFVLFVIFSLSLFFIIQPLHIKTIEYISRKQLDMERISIGGLYAFENKENPRILYFKIEELGKLNIEKDSVQIIAPVNVEKSTMNQWEDFQKLEMTPSEEKWKIYAYFPYKAKSFFSATPIRNSTATFFKSIPEGFANGLLRPFPTDPGSPSYIFPAMLEVWFCIGIFIYSFLFRKKTTIFEKRILGGLAIFIVTSLILIGFTTPVVGALVRYRIPAFMALLVVSFILLKIPEKWKNRIQ